MPCPLPPSYNRAATQPVPATSRRAVARLNGGTPLDTAGPDTVGLIHLRRIGTGGTMVRRAGFFDAEREDAV